MDFSRSEFNVSHHHHHPAHGQTESMTDAEKFKIILDHWIEHNTAHREEFERWAQRARGAGLGEVFREVEAAAGKLAEANAHLLKAMSHL